MSLLDRLTSPRAFRLLLVSIAVLCATSAGAATIWHPRCGYALKAGHPSPRPKKVPGATSPSAFRFAERDSQKAVPVRTERPLVLPVAPFHAAASPVLPCRSTADDRAVDLRLTRTGSPRAPPRPLSTIVLS